MDSEENQQVKQSSFPGSALPVVNISHSQVEHDNNHDISEQNKLIKKKVPKNIQCQIIWLNVYAYFLTNGYMCSPLYNDN